MDNNVQLNPIIKGGYKPDFDFKKIKINDVGRYSITRPYEAKQIIIHIQRQITKFLNKKSEECSITDGTAGVGGDTLHFSKYFKNVNAVDILEENTKLLNENCKTFGITNVNIVCGDYTKLINELIQDVVYIDPPWGGVGYKTKSNVDLQLSGMNISGLIAKFDANAKSLIFLKLPLNANLINFNIEEKFIVFNKKNIPSFYLIQLKYTLS
jgi:16S rRNA G966 N2-methylase RsmD